MNHWALNPPLTWNMIWDCEAMTDFPRMPDLATDHSRYTFIPQQPDHCAPACIQMILHRRCITYDTQSRILADMGGKPPLLEEIEAYVQSRGIPSRAYPANKSFEREFFQLGRAALESGCDIIISYSHGLIYGTGTLTNHATLLTGIRLAVPRERNYPSWHAVLLDPQHEPDGIARHEFDTIERGMLARGGGIVLCHPDARVLDELIAQYP